MNWATFNHFVKDKAGNMALTLGLAIIPLLAAAGGAIDYARFTSARTDLQATLDAATLAGTQAYAENGGRLSEAIAISRKFYTSQIESSGYELTENRITFQLNPKRNGIQAIGNVRIKMPFLSVVGINDLPILSVSAGAASVAEAGSSGSNLEVSLMLDVTGSMCDDKSGPCKTGTKISGVKSAASTLVDNVLNAAPPDSTTRFAVVPFNNEIRVEPDGQAGSRMKAMTNLNPTWSGYYQYCSDWVGTSTPGATSEDPGSSSGTCNKTQTDFVNWKLIPCVTDRFYNATTSFDYTDDAPGPNRWMNAWWSNRAPYYSDSTDTPMTSGTGATAADPSGGNAYSSDGSCFLTDNANIVVPLTNSKETLHQSIDGLVAYSGTGGALATAMSWFTISPNWESVWGSASKPGPYSELKPKIAGQAPPLRKIVVMMTDGGYNSYRGWLGQDINFVSNGAKSICQAMKDKGIEIYTVGFDFGSLPTAESSVAKATLQSCATDASHFYNSQDVVALQSAFTAISQKIAGNTTHLTQ